MQMLICLLSTMYKDQPLYVNFLEYDLYTQYADKIKEQTGFVPSFHPFGDFESEKRLPVSSGDLVYAFNTAPTGNC